MARLVRRFVSDFHDELVLGSVCSEGYASPQASRLSMAAHELVENAITHAAEGEASFSIEIGPDPEDPARRYRVEMKTRNRAVPGDHEAIDALLRALRAAADPFDVFLELMASTVKRTDGSGLGLARVWVEAQMDLACLVDGEQLEITARASIVRDSEDTERDPSRGQAPS
ncbi:hypothetical protein [Paraliomyxa miuraensis]|uniref:hypothetical protein n=1 Tax=Paraliomyxa miuraensis TaxID=376150 RepID=UPI002255F7BA|nr:hypothetical protein [Paraliomyxa miuraensis]MCX4241887.1 hypothetical protein [Paraliomyxa miuraensis]